MPSMADSKDLHFVLFPLMAQGHMIPMVDIARLLASRGMVVTIVTTPRNAARFASPLSRAASSGLRISVIELPFPAQKAGLPEEYEILDMLPSMDKAGDVLLAARELQQPADELFEKMSPNPTCIIADMCLPWTDNIARKYNVPRIAFIGFSCFSKLCVNLVYVTKAVDLDTIASDTEYFTIPELPDEISVTKLQMPFRLKGSNYMEQFHNQMAVAEANSFGVIVNSFEELEPAYIDLYKKKRGSKVWCIGPVSLYNKNMIDKVERGNKTSIDEHKILQWLDTKQRSSVLYVCLGSLCNLRTSQMMELGMALEALNKPFIWAIRKGEITKKIENWVAESGLEERVKDRGLVIRGWAPQVLILSHESIGCFLTHCGWNSTLEAITCGVPVVTWPLFAEQFLNERFAVNVLKIGASVGAETPQKFEEGGDDEVSVTREDISKAVKAVMNGEGSDEMRRRAKELKEMAKRALEEGGSSNKNIGQLIHDVQEQVSDDYSTQD